IPNVAHTGESLEGMRLGKYDKAVIYARKLLDRIYFGNDGKRRLEMAPSPAWASWGEVVVKKKTKETDDIPSFRVAPTDGKPLPPFVPGQHLTFSLDVPGEKRPLVRCYSLSHRHHPTHYRVSVKRDGVASTFFHDAIAEGQKLRLRAPSGRFCVD